MRQHRVTLAVAAAVVLVLALRMTVYTVEDTQVAVVLTFGRPTDEDAEPGVGFKWPAPIQRVQTFDRRLRVLQAPFEELTTRDDRAVLVGTFLVWRIASARTFLEAVREPAAAEQLLLKLLRNHQAAAISSVQFGELVSADRERSAFDAVERAILTGVSRDAASLGVEVSLAGIRRLGLPEEATLAVFERMREDRRKRATAIVERGRQEAERILTDAQAARASRLTAARVEARSLLASAEANARPHFARMAEDAELAVFLRKLEALQRLLEAKAGKPGATLVFDTDDLPFDLLRAGDGE